MSDETGSWSVICVSKDAEGFGWEKGVFRYADGYTRDQAETLANAHGLIPGYGAFVIPTYRRLALFDALLQTLAVDAPRQIM